MKTHADPIGSSCILVTGPCLMCRNAKYLPIDSISLAYPGFRAETEEKVKIGDLVKNLEKWSWDRRTLLSWTCQTQPSWVRMPGDCQHQPLDRNPDHGLPHNLEKLLENCHELGRLLARSTTLLVCPVPRCIINKCWYDPSHIELWQ